MENANELVFVDAEFTGLHAATTLVSIALVSLDGRELYLALNDYDRSQVSYWLEHNVLALLHERECVNSRTAYEKVDTWLQGIAKGRKITLMSAGLVFDIMLLFDLYKHKFAPGIFYNAINDLPFFLKHPVHFDLNTLFAAAGIDPEIDRIKYVGEGLEGVRHDALFDARLVRRCYLKLRDENRLPLMQHFYE